MQQNVLIEKWLRSLTSPSIITDPRLPAEMASFVNPRLGTSGPAAAPQQAANQNWLRLLTSPSIITDPRLPPKIGFVRQTSPLPGRPSSRVSKRPTRIGFVCSLRHRPSPIRDCHPKLASFVNLTSQRLPKQHRTARVSKRPSQNWLRSSTYTSRQNVHL
jgi:hypothetical protein